MNVSNFLSVKDFFNYYVAGWLWLVEAAMIFLSWSGYRNTVHWLEKFHPGADEAGVIVVGLFLVIVPYIVGFTLSPVSGYATKLLRKISDDPKDWIIDYSAGTKNDNYRHKGKRLNQTKIRLIVKKLKQVFGDEKTINEKNLKNWFFPIRAFVINSQGEAASFAIRAQDLVNFTESILLPLPLIFLTIGVRILCKSNISGWAFVLFGLLILYLLSYRYMKLRFYWVKHVYNTFLVIANDNRKLEK